MKFSKHELLLLFMVTSIAIFPIALYITTLSTDHIVINNRDDLKDVIDKIKSEIDSSNVPLFYYDTDILFDGDEFEIIPISEITPNSYPINEPRDYEEWKKHFFEDNKIEKARYIHVKVDPDQNGMALLQRGEWTYKINGIIVPDDMELN